MLLPARALRPAQRGELWLVQNLNFAAGCGRRGGLIRWATVKLVGAGGGRGWRWSVSLKHAEIARIITSWAVF